nr:hypothetical protein [Tanacetum cinerariifolium]
MKETCETLRNKVLELTVSTTNDLMKESLSKIVNDAVNQETESSQAVGNALILQEFAAYAPRSLKNFSRFTCRIQDDAFRKRDNNEHQGDDAPPKGEKSKKRKKNVEKLEVCKRSYQIKINLTASTLTFLDIEACDPLSIVDAPTLMFLDTEACDPFSIVDKPTTEVKMKIFETKFLKKAPLLGILDLKIMKAYEGETEKRLKHHKQMRRYESFVNKRPILQTMKRQK